MNIEKLTDNTYPLKITDKINEIIEKIVPLVNPASTTDYGVVKVDSALSATSTNPVENKAVKTELASIQTNMDSAFSDVATALEGKVNTADLEECHVIVETYSDGTSWYRLYSDGWCKQGGRLVIKSTSAAALDYATATLTFLKPFTQLLNWQVQPSHDCFQGVFAGISYGGAYASVSVGQKNMTSSSYINPYVSWEAEGYVE